MDKIIDSTNEEAILEKVNLFMHGLKEGLLGLGIDFGFHLEDAWKDEKIHQLSNSIRYRLNSSKFHFQLLYSQLSSFREKHQVLVNSPLPPEIHLEIDKVEHSSLLDSIIFHLCSAMDYTSIITNYILSKKHENIKWSSIVKSARANTNIFSKDKANDIKKTLIEIDSDFGNALYKYRSELIHNSDDVCGYNHSWNLLSGKVSLTFLCTKKVVQHFKKIGDKKKDYSTTYFSQFVIFETIDAIKKIVLSLRKYLAENLKAEDFIVSNKKPLIYFDKDGNQLGAASIYNWKEFDRIFVPIESSKSGSI